MRHETPDFEDFSDLSALWQRSGEVPVERLVTRLRKHNQKLRRLNQLSFIVCIFAVIIIFVLEFAGRLPTGGLLSAAGVAGIAYSWWKYRRDKAKLIAAYSEEPDKLLPFLIGRTKAARNLGRYYYLCGLPSVLTGFVVARLTLPETQDAGEGASKGLLVFLAGIGLVCMVAITIWGVRLARQKTRELKTLEEMREEL